MLRSRFASSGLKLMPPGFGLVAVLMVSVPAQAAAYVPQGLNPTEAQGVGRICRGVMGLEPGEEHFQSCLDTLADQVRALKRGRQVSDARAACLEHGLAPGSPALAECEAARSEAARQVVTPIDADLGPAPKSYFYASPTEVRRRERMACARLGLEPAAPGFNSCVAGLQSAMFSADNPEN